MDHLSACYFCGTAMDDPLQDYRVVPVELRESDDVTTATLCPSCHDKLERVLAPVVESAGGSGVTLDASGSERVAASSPPGNGGTDADADADADESGDGTDPADPETGPDESPAIDAEDGLVDVENAPLGGSDASTAPGDDPRETTGANVPDDQSDGDEAGAASSDTATGESDTDGERDTADETGEADGESPARDTTGRTSVSAREYNKVLRLLQNREFPVDRTEFETVAANAYGLAEHECARILDVAIDRGLVAEAGGELVRSE